MLILKTTFGLVSLNPLKHAKWIHQFMNKDLDINNHMSLKVMFYFTQFTNLLTCDMKTKISNVFEKFDFQGLRGSIQFWDMRPAPASHSSGFNLTATDQPFRLVGDHEGLLNYRTDCLKRTLFFVDLEKNTGSWLPGRVAQTELADHWTKPLPDEEYPQLITATRMGRLVLPVFELDHEECVGVIELVTVEPKETCVEDFNQICKLLEDENLRSSYMAKIIKVEHKGDIIKFSLPFSATMGDLLQNVTMRLKKLKKRSFSIKYKDNDNDLLSITSNSDLQECISRSSSLGMTTIRMVI